MSQKIRILIAAVALSLVVYWAGPSEVLSTLKGINLGYFAILILLSFPLIWASCLKWQLFLMARGHNVSVLFLMRHYTISYFFNNFAPSFIGGDIARSLSVGKHLGNKRDAFLSTILERFTGLFAMALLALIFLLLGSNIPLAVTIFVLLVVSITGLLAVCLFSKGAAEFLYPIFLSFTAKLKLSKLHPFTDKIFEGLSHARGNYPLFWRAMLYSLFFHILTVLNTYVAALTVGWDGVSVWQLFVVVPLVLLIGMIPITPGGLGLQEGAFTYFLAELGATTSQALGVGLVLRIKVLAIAIVGALLWVSNKKVNELND